MQGLDQRLEQPGCPQTRSGEDCLSPTTKRAGEGLTAPAAAAALRVPMDVRFLKSKHSSTPSSPAQPNRPCTLEIPQALIPGDLAGMGDRKRPSARFSLRCNRSINIHHPLYITQIESRYILCPWEPFGSMKLPQQVIENPHGSSWWTRTNPQTKVSGTKDKFDLLQTCNFRVVRS